MTIMEFEEKYKDWRFPVPPVCTAFWTADDWARYVEHKGHATYLFTVGVNGHKRTERAQTADDLLRLYASVYGSTAVISVSRID